MAMRKKILGVASLAFAMALSAGVAVAAGAEGETPDWSKFDISATAVRTQEPAGLRFKVDCPVDYSEDSTVNAYTVLKLTTSEGETYTKKVNAEVWREDNTGWNTVLTHFPDTEYATEVFAQAFVVLEDGTTYETGSVSANIAQTAAKAMVEGIATKAEVGHYAQGLVATATFDVAGGTISAPYAEQTVYVNNAVENPATFVTPYLAGKAFAGWTLNGEAFDFATPITEDITLAATYEDGAPIVIANAPSSYLVYETQVKPEGVDHTWKVNRKPGSHFEYFNFNADQIVEGASKYTFKVMVEFTPSSDRPAGENLYWGTTGAFGWFTLKVNGVETKRGMVIGEWYTIEIDAAAFETACANNGFLWLADNVPLAGNAKLYMTDIKAIMSTHSVTFDVAGGTGATYASQSVADGECATNPATFTAPYVAGKAFAGWTLNGEAFDFAMPITEDITLVAAYKDGAPIVNAGAAVNCSIFYTTDVQAEGTDYLWKITRNPSEGWNEAFNFNADQIVEGASKYTFKVMVEFTPSSDRPAGEDLYWGTTGAFGWFRILIGAEVVQNGLKVGEWYTIEVDAAAFASNNGFIWGAANNVLNVPATLYMTDVTAVSP